MTEVNLLTALLSLGIGILIGYLYGWDKGFQKCSDIHSK